MLLKILSKFYYLGIKVRSFLYKTGIFKTYRLNTKVISIGNITWGGTGKTNLVYYLAKNLSEKGQKVAILTRGYKRKERKMVAIEKFTPNIDWQKIGDEAYLLSYKLKSVPVLIEKNRVKSGRWATAKYSVDYLILDDGFQHKRLARDLDIVTVDAQDPFGNDKLIPAGKLREPIDSIKRADILVINRAGQSKNKKELINKLKSANSYAPIIEIEYEIEKIYAVKNEKESFSLNKFKGKKILGFCGIGNPQSFKNTLQDLGAGSLDFVVFRDHYAYKYEDMRKLEKQAVNKKADFLLTTEKDKVRLPVNQELKLPICVVKVKCKITSGEKTLWGRIYGR